MFVQSRITQKYQATIPLPVREALELTYGDTVAFEFLKGGEIVIRKAPPPVDTQYIAALEATLSEWGTEADNEAFGDL